ncbi:MAG: hypothetical protein ACRD9L_09895, partial [Bryobacteraceae bacterium]
PRTRFGAPDLLQWQAFWEEGGEYQEYDDDLSYDESYTAQAGSRSGIYTRLNASSQERNKADQLEIAPTSICFGRDDLEMLVACQRRANFNHPVRIDVVGMNNVRIDPTWLPAIRGSLADRCFLYAQLSRWRDQRQHDLTTVRIFLPEFLPRGSTVTAVAEGPADATAIPVNIRLEHPKHTRALHPARERSVKGRAFTEGLHAGFQAGDQLTAQVHGYEIGADGELCVLLAKQPSTDKAFAEFRRRFRLGAQADVEMLRVLEDPLGRSPMFLVREETTGLEVPMADTDFCGDTVPRAFYGRRFAVGERFEVRIEEMDTGLRRVRLSRGRQLLKEYLSMLGGEDSRLTKVEVKRADPLGVYVGAPGSGFNSFVAFVRHALWPAELSKERGSVHEARIRRFERQFNLDDLRKLSQTEELLPRELDLGIDCDLLLPLAYGRFAEAWRVGDFFPGAVVDKALDGGGLLVSLPPDLKGIIWESELGLDQEGKLRRARSFARGDELRPVIIRMNDSTKAVRLSLSRIPVPPPSLKGSLIEVVVLHTRQDRDSLELTCSLDRKYAVKAKVPLSEEDSLKPQCVISVKVLKINATNLIEAEFRGL